MTDTAWTVAEVEGHAATLRGHVATTFNKHKGREMVPSSIFFYATINPETHEPQKMLVVCPNIPIPSANDPSDRDDIDTMLQNFAEVCAASGCVFVTEAWTLTPPEAIAKQGAKAIRDYLRKQGGDWSEHPDREEVVRMHLEHHRIGVKLWHAPIVRSALGDGTLGEWEVVSHIKNSGRFTNFLGHENRS